MTSELVFTKEQGDRWVAAMRRFGEAYSEAVRRLGPAIRKFHETLWREYRAAGMPYGENERGLHRWMHERRDPRGG